VRVTAEAPSQVVTTVTDRSSSAPSIQVKYPYGTFFNITDVGTSPVQQPFNLFVNATLKI
jgi:hypothetical protein